MEDYKEKYEQALERAKICYKDLSNLDGVVATMSKDFFEEVFPELAQSEDEKIRKALIDFVEQYGHKYYGAMARASAISWLEKQNHDGKKWIYEDVYIKEKEQVFQDGIDEVLENPQKYGLEKQGSQKPTDKVEPKFNVGDWIISSEGKLRHIVDVDKTGYQTDNGWLSHEHYEKRFHLWTIQDAKDGDVLCGYPTDTYPWIGIFHELNDDYTFSSYCYLQAGITGKFCPPSGVNIFNRRNVDEHSLKSIVPATKEQRDILFQKMKEAGYEWDAEKKELRKIEKNHVWSEEDETFTRDAVAAAEEYYTKGCGQEKLVVWLKSLKDRLKGEWI